MNEINKCDHGKFHKTVTGATRMGKIKILLIGGGIGALLALLFARKSGSELRDDIADVTRKGYDATKEGAKVLKERSANVVQMVTETADSAYEYAASKFSTVSDDISDVASASTEAVADGIDRMQNESGKSSTNAAKAS
jgi:gas vesicle protein